MHPIRIVLVGPQHPGNIGAAARAMKTMGLEQLRLVAPERYPHVDATTMAVGAGDVLDAAQVVPELAEAVADCGLVLGCTARSRYVSLPGYDPGQAARALIGQAEHTPVALVFGRERTGLSNEELAQCHGAVHIPAVAGFSSLNLAAAVQVLSYEVRLAMLNRDDDEPLAAVHSDACDSDQSDDQPGVHQELEQLFIHLEKTLHAIDFYKSRPSDVVMQRLRRLFLRAQPTRRELRILHGILADAERMARLARGQQ